jgi:hypothetical protein
MQTHRTHNTTQKQHTHKLNFNDENVYTHLETHIGDVYSSLLECHWVSGNGCFKDLSAFVFKGQEVQEEQHRITS